MHMPAKRLYFTYFFLKMYNLVQCVCHLAYIRYTTLPSTPHNFLLKAPLTMVPKPKPCPKEALEPTPHLRPTFVFSYFPI